MWKVRHVRSSKNPGEEKEGSVRPQAMSAEVLGVGVKVVGGGSGTPNVSQQEEGASDARTHNSWKGGKSGGKRGLHCPGCCRGPSRPAWRAVHMCACACMCASVSVRVSECGCAHVCACV